MTQAFPPDAELERLLSSSAPEILSALPDGIVVADLSGRVIWMNSAALHLPHYATLSSPQNFNAGATQDFHVYSASGHLIAPDDWPLCRVLRGDTVDSLELEVRCPDPDLSFFGSFGGRGVFSPDGEPAAIVLTVRDLTQSRHFERELKAAEEERRVAFEAADMGAWNWELESGTVRMSARARDYFGFAADQPITFADIRAAMHPEDWTGVSKALEAAISGRSDYEAEFRVKYNGGSERWLASRGRASDNAEGKPFRMHGVVIDITERRRQEQELQAVQQQFHHSQKLESLGVLAGGVAHDFNNLLTGILGNASLVLNTLPDDDFNRPMLEEVMRSGERAADLTRQLLAYAGKGRFVTRPIHLSELIRDMHRLIRSSIPKLVHIAHHLARNLPVIQGDTAQIQQVVMNLMLNAAEAIGTGEPGTVLIETIAGDLTSSDLAGFVNADTLQPGAYVMLHVHDTGCGMDEITKARIFDPFFSTKFTGRGLGLSAVMGIVRGHRGAFKVESEPGRGTTFTVLFPTAPQQPVVEEPLRGGPEMILAVGHCVAQMQALRNLGYPVLFCESLRMADAILRDGREPVAVVICSGGDENFPAAVHHHRPDVHVILSSKDHPSDQIRRYPGQRFSAYVHERATTEDLDRTIRQTLSSVVL